ncbi:MAG: FAD-dependent oxidoreductase, partial [Cyanobacteria bacterium J06560_2]
MAESSSPNICIVGGGFGGLYTALYLQKYRHLKNSHITLIEPNDQFVFFPMMYELITDELKQWELFPTYSSLLAGTNVRWQQSHAEKVDLQRQSVTTSSGEVMKYDYLVLATGAKNRQLDIPGLEQHTLTFRSFHDALMLQARLGDLVRSQTFQAQSDPSDTIEPIPIAVVGGGASGVELACKVADYLGNRGEITLIDRGSSLLPAFPNGIRQQAKRALAKRRVNILLETGVSAIEADTVTLQRSEES